jgi:hypothetical protein
MRIEGRRVEREIGELQSRQMFGLRQMRRKDEPPRVNSAFAHFIAQIAAPRDRK